MDLGSAGLVAALVGAVIGLTRIVEHLILKKKRNGNGLLTKEQSDELHRLHEMHNVRDVNGVPRWYVPGNLIKIVEDINIEQKMQWREIKNDMKEIRNDQDIISNRISELVNSQSRVVDRMSDLIRNMESVLQVLVKKQ